MLPEFDLAVLAATQPDMEHSCMELSTDRAPRAGGMLAMCSLLLSQLLLAGAEDLMFSQQLVFSQVRCGCPSTSSRVTSESVTQPCERQNPVNAVFLTLSICG